jgi:hypothetical protein
MILTIESLNLRTQGTKTEGRKRGIELGIKFPLPKLENSIWELEIFRRKIFLRHPICELHQNRIGLLGRMMLYFGKKKGKKWCEGKFIP